MNIGNPGEFTVLALAEAVRRATGSGSPIIFAPAACDDPRQRRPDISLAERLLGWKPRVSLDEGLARTIEHFRGTLAPPRPVRTRRNEREPRRADARK